MWRDLSPGERRWLVAILGAGLVLRAAWCVWAARPPSADLHDPNFYLLYGEQLARGNGYRLPSGAPTAYYPPGYPFALAPFFWLLYRTPLPDSGEVATVAVLNVTWQLGTIVASFLLARHLTGRTTAGLVAGGLLALWPNLIVHTAVALTESLFLLLLVLSLLVAVSAPWEARRWEPWRLVVVGLLLGAATLVRPVTVPLLVVLPAALLAARAGWRRTVGHTLVVGACVLAVLLPWIVRNAVVMDALTLSTNTGDNLCMSRRVGGSGGFEFPNERCFPARFEQIPRPRTEVLRDRHGRDEALAFVREHPGEEVRLVGRRLLRTFESDADGIEAVESYGSDPWLGDGTRSLLRAVATGYGLAVGLLAAPGLWLLVRRSPAGLLVGAGGASMLLAPLAFFGDPRFHVPLVPVAAVAVGVLATAVGPWRTAAEGGTGAPVRSRDP